MIVLIKPIDFWQLFFFPARFWTRTRISLQQEDQQQGDVERHLPVMIDSFLSNKNNYDTKREKDRRYQRMKREPTDQWHHSVMPKKILINVKAKTQNGRMTDIFGARSKIGAWMEMDGGGRASSGNNMALPLFLLLHTRNLEQLQLLLLVLWKETAYSRLQDFPIYLYIAWASQLNSRWSSLNSCRNSTESK